MYTLTRCTPVCTLPRHGKAAAVLPRNRANLAKPDLTKRSPPPPDEVMECPPDTHDNVYVTWTFLRGSPIDLRILLMLELSLLIMVLNQKYTPMMKIDLC